jgi:ribokinase
MQLEIPLETVAKAAGIAKCTGIKVILNPAPACPLDNALLSSLSVITPNELELELLTGIPVTDVSSVEKAALALLDKGLEVVIVTLGSKGAYLKTRAKSKLVSGFHVDAVDATAAGDVFNGALSVAIVEGKTLEEAIRFANAAAALSATKLGAQTSIPRRDEIERMLLCMT